MMVEGQPATSPTFIWVKVKARNQVIFLALDFHPRIPGGFFLLNVAIQLGVGCAFERDVWSNHDWLVVSSIFYLHP